MNRILVCIFVLLPLMTFTQGLPSNIGTEQDLVGEWLIDLRPTPDSEPYNQIFVVEQVSENALIGSFYGSTIEQGFINTNWPRLYFAFTTSDGSHRYYHSGYLENGILSGTSYCPGRTFIAPWTGERN